MLCYIKPLRGIVYLPDFFLHWHVEGVVESLTPVMAFLAISLSPL